MIPWLSLIAETNFWCPAASASSKFNVGLGRAESKIVARRGVASVSSPPYVGSGFARVVILTFAVSLLRLSKPLYVDPCEVPSIIARGGSGSYSFAFFLGKSTHKKLVTTARKPFSRIHPAQLVF